MKKGILKTTMIAVPRSIDGHSLLHKNGSKSIHACLAADLVDGATRMDRPTIRVAAVACGCSPSYVVCALRLSPQQRDEVRAGRRTIPVQRSKPLLRVNDPRKALQSIVDAIGHDTTLDLLAASENHSLRRT
jgi:hypothetical protein